MALLSEQQAKQLILKPQNSSSINAAVSVEERLKLHVDSVMDVVEMQSRFAFFKKWVSKILPPDKMEGFETMWQAPCETNELTESIFAELSRVMEAHNASTVHKFKNEEDRAEFSKYLSGIKDEKFWTFDYWNEIKSDQNSFLIIDLPSIQTTAKPQPYHFILDIDCVLDVYVTRKGIVEYIIFWSGLNKIVVIDEQAYYTFVTEKRDVNTATLESVAVHGLGRVPACPIYFNPISKTNTLSNHNPITKSLGSLDWLLFFEIARKCLETYAPFPIYATYAELEDAQGMTDSQGEQGLDIGITLAHGERILGTGKNRSAANKKLIGPGTVQRYDAPKDSQDSDLLSNPIQVIPAEEVSLNYCKAAIKERSESIFAKCVGRGGDVLNAQAANELQVQSTFESRVNILSQIRQIVETTKSFVYGVMADLMFDKTYVSSDVSMGNQYFLNTPDQQQASLKAAKESGLPFYEIQNQRQSIYNNMYKDQPYLLKRNITLSQLEPYPGLTIAELLSLVPTGVIDTDKLKIKIDFENLIARFEREESNVVSFGSEASLKTKINSINTKLIKYVAESDPSKQVRITEPPGAGKFG